MSGRKYKLTLELDEEELGLLKHALWYETLFNYSEGVARQLIKKIDEQLNEQGDDKEKG
jgi:hypothetical protein